MMRPVSAAPIAVDLSRYKDRGSYARMSRLDSEGVCRLVRVTRRPDRQGSVPPTSRAAGRGRGTGS